MKDESQQKQSLRELMPELSDEEFPEAERRLKNYMATVSHIYDRVVNEVNGLSKEDPQLTMRVFEILIALGVDISNPTKRTREENIVELMNKPALALRVANTQEKRELVSAMLMNMTLKDKKLNCTVAPPFDKWQKQEEQPKSDKIKPERIEGVEG